MFEGMNSTHQTGGDEEDYILAMRTTAYREDSELWRLRRSRSLKPGQPNLLGRRKTKAKVLIPMSDDHTTKVLASLLPDEIIYDVSDYSNRPYDVCLLFGDVSGFTDLSEMYNKTGKGGPSRLTMVLNSYIGSMVQEIMSHNGDVLKFSGDAFLCMWKVGPNDSMQDVVHEALDSAIIIQKTLGTYETDVGVVLKVKLAISAGHAVFSIIGDSKISHYVVVGQPIEDCKKAEKKASAGEIIVSASAWNYSNPNEYLWEPVHDGVHIKVKGVGLNWRPTQRNVDKLQHKQDDELDSPPASSIRLIFDDEESLKGAVSDIRVSQDTEGKSIRSEDFSLRPSVNYAAKANLKDDLRKFIIPPIMRGIDLDEPLEYLTEMRQIVIVFINVVVNPKLDVTEYIKLINQAYINVCTVVTEMQGCVNKLSLFDKDLMFVLLFGLRGYKHELECQIGLRCASECYQSISKLTHVTSTSIAVTTGMTYCGVVGHTLRREYTVISLTVNKAARLMVAYPDKVTCDRETFLHSKLEARNFILQQPKALKGITNVGPVYEFKEQQRAAEEKPAINPFPLLGRSDEMRLYRHLLDECIDINRTKGKAHTLQQLNHHNTLVIRGTPQTGKSRLLDEFIYCTPSHVPVNRLALTKRDAKIPYQTIQRILSTPLGLSELNSADDRETKLKLRLQKVKIPDFFSALNTVFNVNFDKTPFYMSLSEEQQSIALQKILKQLCYIGFVTLWVIAIDDAEFIDDESWNYLNLLMEWDVTFIVMMMGSHVELSPPTAPVLTHRRVRYIDLKPIDKWYHAGLACQILDVHAIPPELEKLIQTRSSGNPGWIESFLVSLVQTGGLLIQNLSKSDINEMGLVSPPVDMMVRLSSEDTKDLELASSFHTKPEHEKPENEDADEDVEDLKEDGWKMYKFSYRDSIINLMKEKIREKRLKFGSLIPVCIISPSFKLEELVDPELSMDVMIIKMFDSLSSYEQLLLKCSAVLGEYFPREMLLYIMVSATPRPTALAVQKLFELRVLACAQGDFSQGDTGMMFTQRLTNPNRDIGVRCDCRGVKIHETCLDLPKYASCGYMRFRLAMFQETTYNLLTDNQKKEFHNRAIRYLEKETRRCRACGNGFFVRILGTRNDDGFIRKVKRKVSDKPRSRSQSTLSNISARNSQEFGFLARTSSEYANNASFSNSSRPLIRKDTFGNVLSPYSETNAVGRGFSSEILLPRFCFGFGLVNKLKYSISLTRTFSYADFSSCQCPLILNTMYTQMLEHCKGAGATEKMMDAMLEYAYICILSCNIPQAMRILEDAVAVIESQQQEKEEAEEEALWRIPIVRGKIETLLGHARLELGQLEEAYVCFHRALKFYGYSFPKRKLSVKLHTFTYELKHRLGMFLFPSMFVATVSGYEAEFYDNLSECLALFCQLFKDVQMWDHAELAAAWSLNKSLASDTDFYGLCTAYSNMLEVAHHLGKETICVALEVHALRLCHRKKSSVEAQELKAVAMLYGAIFCSRLMRSEVEHSIHVGYIMLRICATVHAIQTSLQVLPLLVHALLIRCRISEAVTMILELEYCSEEDTDNSGRTWFFALCVVLQLETGYTLVPFKKCERFYQIEGDTLINIRDPDAERRYYTVMWLWCVRNEEWEAATVWYTRACDFTLVKSDDSLNNVFTALYLLEGLLLYVVGKMDKRNIEAVGQAYHEINVLIKAIENATTIAKIIIPRFSHLKAYYKFIRNDEPRAFNLLAKAKADADKHGNLLEFAWIEHSEKAWSNNLPALMVDFWKEHCEADNLMDYHEVDLNEGKLGLYTMPIPLYY